MIGTGVGEVSKWLSKKVKKLNGIKSNLTSTKICKLRTVQLQVIVNIMTYSINKWCLIEKVGQGYKEINLTYNKYKT